MEVHLSRLGDRGRYPPFSTRNETTILNLLPALANPLRRVG